MRNNDDFISLRKFRSDEDTILDLLEAGMKSKASLYVQSTESIEMILLSPAQLQKIRTCHPEKVSVIIGSESQTFYNKVTNSESTRRIRLYQPLSFHDLWIVKAEAETLVKKPLSQHTSLSETEKSTMLKMILGMAIGKYGFKIGHERNSASGCNKGSIKWDLEQVGLKNR